jgi:hypothetical protein
VSLTFFSCRRARKFKLPLASLNHCSFLACLTIINGPLQFNCIAIAYTKFSLLKVNTLSSLDCCVRLWLCDILFPLQLLSSIRHFQNHLGDHLGEIRVALGPPSLSSFMSFAVKLIVKLTLQQFLPRFSHHELVVDIYVIVLEKHLGGIKVAPRPSPVKQ